MTVERKVEGRENRDRMRPKRANLDPSQSLIAFNFNIEGGQQKELMPMTPELPTCLTQDSRRLSCRSARPGTAPASKPSSETRLLGVRASCLLLRCCLLDLT